MNEIIREAILIRSVEEKLLNLFVEGKLNGTVNTCIGQGILSPYGGALTKDHINYKTLKH